MLVRLVDIAGTVADGVRSGRLQADPGCGRGAVQLLLGRPLAGLCLSVTLRLAAAGRQCRQQQSPE